MADAKTKVAFDVIEKLLAAKPDEMRLIGGEMTMQEIRTAKAFLELAKTRITNLSAAPKPADVPHDVVRALEAARDQAIAQRDEELARANLLASIIRDCPDARTVWGKTIEKETEAELAAREMSPLATPAPSTSTEEALVEQAARASYEYEGDRKGIDYAGWDLEPESVKRQWRESVAVPLAVALADNARLRANLRNNFCPRPSNHRPDQFDVGGCVDAGECGCMNVTALSR